MRVIHEIYETSWIGLSVAIRADEIPILIDRLHALEGGRIDHFHFRNDKWDGKPRVADVEVSLLPPDEVDNMVIESTNRVIE